MRQFCWTWTVDVPTDSNLWRFSHHLWRFHRMSGGRMFFLFTLLTYIGRVVEDTIEMRHRRDWRANITRNGYQYAECKQLDDGVALLLRHAYANIGWIMVILRTQMHHLLQHWKAVGSKETCYRSRNSLKNKQSSIGNKPALVQYLEICAKIRSCTPKYQHCDFRTVFPRKNYFNTVFLFQNVLVRCVD